MLPDRKHIRLKGYDYSKPGYYFVTICVKDKQELLGKVIDGIMVSNSVGEIVGNIWRQIPDHYSNVVLDEFVVMPNHIHGIIGIESVIKDTPWRVPTGLQSLVPASLPAIVNQYKGAVKRMCNTKGYSDFSWQSRFYDHVIRKDESLEKIREYIRNNPLKWELEKNNLENLWM